MVFPNLSGIGVHSVDLSFQVRTGGGHVGAAVHEVEKGREIKELHRVEEMCLP
jgi:hypothetical protein